MNLLAGKKALIFGVANDRSLGWAIARHLHALGAEVGFSYQNERLERRVKPLALSLGATLIERCDLANPSQLDALFTRVREAWGTFDILIHAVAFARMEELEGRFLDVTAEGFQLALGVSAYSLVELARRSEPLLNSGSRIITLSYHGAHKVVPHYHVMGVAKAALEACTRYLAYELGEKKITVNAVSAGPIKTLAAAGIKNFQRMLDYAQTQVPLRENITSDDVGALTAYLCGPGGAHITGTTLYVDSGAHIMGAQIPGS